MGFDYRAIYQLPGAGSIDLGGSPSRAIKESLVPFMENGVDFGSVKVDENVITALEIYFDQVKDEINDIHESIYKMDNEAYVGNYGEDRVAATHQSEVLSNLHDFLWRVIGAAQTANRYPGHEVEISYS